MLTAAITAAMLLTLSFECSGVSPDKPQPTPVHVLHLRIDGDLDTARLGAMVADEQRDAIADLGDGVPGFGLVILELTGNRWRADAVTSVWSAVRKSAVECGGGGGGARVAVWLRDEGDQRVGGGQAAMALLADAAYVEPRTRVVPTADGDLDRDRSDPYGLVDEAGADDADGDAGAGARGELGSLVWAAVQARGGDVLLTTLFPSPTQTLWYEDVGERSASGVVVVDGRTRPVWKLRASAPEANTDAAEPAGAGVLSVDELDAGELVSLRVVRGVARDSGQIVSDLGLRPRKIERRSVASPLPGVRERARKLVEGLDKTRRDVDAAMYKVERRYGTEWLQRKQRAGREAAEKLAQARNALDELDELLTEYAELSEEAPPRAATSGSYGMSTSTRAGANRWALLVRELRSEVEGLDRRARRLAE